ncbi:MAG: extracellular solute-binding protein [bacterium]|nr:extracellular solute-binding protein [bacterium]
MNFTRSQLIILGSVGAVLLFIILLVTGIIPGLRNSFEKPPEITLTVWGIEDRAFFQENLVGYQTLRPNVQVNYEELDADNYEGDLINALASGKGPDIMMFHNSWLPKHFNKLVPVSDLQMKLKTLQEVFPTVIEQDFAPDGKIYALPLYIDTLALFYNQDIFDRNGVAVAPKDWLDFQNLIPKLRQKDASSKITKAAAAIGGSEKSIDKASDLLMLLMLQAGTKMTDSEFSSATFGQNVAGLLPGLDAMNFYSKFTKADNTYYTWNDNFKYSLDAFSSGDSAMIFNYASSKTAIKNKNPFLNFKVSQMPQPKSGEKAVNYADYWGLSATNNSKSPDWAWDLILYLTANDTSAENYLKVSNRPPALRTLIQKYSDHPELGVFAKQALTARSWPQIDKKSISVIFSEMIQSVINGNLDAAAAISQAERQVTELMRARR